MVWDHQRLECRYRPVIMAHIVMGVGHVVARGLNGAVETCTLTVQLFEIYSTSPRNGNPANGNHLDQSLSFSQKNGNSLTWVLVALTVCFTYPVLYRVSSESRAGEWEL